MAAFVTFEDVSKVYHSGEIEIRAVDHISFTIEKGEFCVIVGPSGAGKTTVLNMLGGMDAWERLGRRREFGSSDFSVTTPEVEGLRK